MHEKFTFPFCFRLHHAFSAKKLLFDFEALKFYQAAYTPAKHQQDEQFEHHLCHGMIAICRFTGSAKRFQNFP